MTLMIFGAFLIGVVVGALGAVVHRTALGDATWPAGFLLALAMALCAAFWCRSMAGLPTLLAGTLGWIVATQVLSLEGRGGDIIIVGPSADLPWAWTGVAFLYGGLALWIVVAFCKRSWFERVERAADGWDHRHEVRH